MLTTAFGGVAGIITGKAWINALRVYRLITTVLFQDFSQSGAKTNQDLSEYPCTGIQRVSGREALGGLPDQAHSSSLAVNA